MSGYLVVRRIVRLLVERLARWILSRLPRRWPAPPAPGVPPAPWAVPLADAALCADCSAVFDARAARACPGCAGRVFVGVGALIDKSSRLARPYRAPFTAAEYGVKLGRMWKETT